MRIFALIVLASMFLAMTAPAQDNPDVLAATVELLDHEYLERKHLDANAMLEKALDRVSEAYPQMMFTLERQGTKSHLALTMGRVQMSQRNLALDNLRALERTLREVRSFMVSNLEQKGQESRIGNLMATGMVTALDAHTRLMSAQAFRDFQAITSGRFGGLGIIVAKGTDGLRVLGVYPDSPGAEADIRPGDRLVQVAGQSARHMTLDEATLLLRGPEGSFVRVVVAQAADGTQRTVDLQRRKIQVASVDAHGFDEGDGRTVGYLRLRLFQEQTTEEVHRRLDKLKPDAPGFHGLILDLRDDQGGVLEEAVNTAELFLNQGLILKTRQADGTGDAVEAQGGASVYGGPLVVLVGHHTASAAEVLAAALKANRRALVLGERTYGKAVVQSLYPLADGSALKMTMAAYLTPPERNLHGVGLAPDLWLYPVFNQGGHLHLLPPPEPEREPPLRELPPTPPETHLARMGLWDNVPAHASEAVIPLPATESARQTLLAGDPLINLARRILLLNEKRAYSSLVQNAVTLAQSENEHQQAQISKALAQKNLDWAAGPPGKTTVVLDRIRLETRPGAQQGWLPLRGMAKAGSQIKLGLVVKNTGPAPVFRVVTQVTHDQKHFDPLVFPVGKLAPGQSQEVFQEVTLPTDLPSGAQTLTLQVMDAEGAVLTQNRMILPVEELPRPHFRFSLTVVDNGKLGSTGNGDNRPQPGETLAIKVGLHNNGLGTSGPGRLLLLSEEAGGLTQTLDRQAFEATSPEGHQEVVLHVAYPQNPASAQLSLWLRLEDAVYPEVAQQKHLVLQRDTPLKILNFQGPLLRVEPVSPNQVSPQMRVSGTLLDDTQAKEIVMVLNGHKVFYRPQTEGTSPVMQRFDTSVYLAEGFNTLTLMGRDDEGLETVRRFTLWRGRLPNAITYGTTFFPW